MTFLEAKQKAIRLFGDVILHRGKNRCFVIRDGMPIGDGRSWLEALRSAGEMQMARNALDDAEHARVQKMLTAFRAAHPDINPEQTLSEAQLQTFDAFTEKYDAEQASKKSDDLGIKR